MPDTRSASKGRRLWWALLAMSLAANAAEPPSDPLVRLYYDLELLNYCGIGVPHLKQTFDQQLAELAAAANADDGMLQASRMQAWTAAYREWQNRGLGGFRGWCRVEGQAAAQRFGG